MTAAQRHQLDERNREIARMRREGASWTELTGRFRLSLHRVQAIVHEATTKGGTDGG